MWNRIQQHSTVSHFYVLYWCELSFFYKRLQTCFHLLHYSSEITRAQSCAFGTDVKFSMECNPTLSEETQKQTLCTCNKRQIQQTKMFGSEQVRSIGGCIVMPTKSVFITGLGMKNCWIIARRSRVFNSPSVSWLKLVVVLSLLLVCPVSCAIFPAVVAEAGQQFQCLLLREWRLCLETGQRRTGNEPRLQYEGNPPKWTQ